MPCSHQALLFGNSYQHPSTHMDGLSASSLSPIELYEYIVTYGNKCIIIYVCVYKHACRYVIFPMMY